MRAFRTAALLLAFGATLPVAAQSVLQTLQQRVEAQLQMIENFFGLVNDQVVTMPTAEHILSLDFDSLLSSIEMTKEILQQTAPIMGQLDSLTRDANQLRPSLAGERR